MNERATSFLADMMISILGPIPSWETVDGLIVPSPVKTCALSTEDFVRYLTYDSCTFAATFRGSAPRLRVAALAKT
jgi:hypothetical protein